MTTMADRPGRGGNSGQVPSMLHTSNAKEGQNETGDVRNNQGSFSFEATGVEHTHHNGCASFHKDGLCSMVQCDDPHMPSDEDEDDIYSTFLLCEEPFSESEVEVDPKYLPKTTVELDTLRKDLLFEKYVKLTTDADGRHRLSGPWLQLQSVQDILLNMIKIPKGLESKFLPQAEQMTKLTKPVAEINQDSLGKVFVNDSTNTADMKIKDSKAVTYTQGAGPSAAQGMANFVRDVNAVADSKPPTANYFGSGREGTTFPNKQGLDVLEKEDINVTPNEDPESAPNGEETDKYDNVPTTSALPDIRSVHENKNVYINNMKDTSDKGEHKVMNERETDNELAMKIEMMEIDSTCWDFIKYFQEDRIREIQKEFCVHIAESGVSQLCISGRSAHTCCKAKVKLKSLARCVSEEMKKEYVKTTDIQACEEDIKGKVQEVQMSFSNKVLLRYHPEESMVHISGLDQESCSAAKVLLFRILGLEDCAKGNTQDRPEQPGDEKESGFVENTGSNTIETGSALCGGLKQVNGNRNKDRTLETSKDPSSERDSSKEPINTSTTLAANKFGSDTLDDGTDQRKRDVTFQNLAYLGNTTPTDSSVNPDAAGKTLAEKDTAGHKSNIRTLYACSMPNGVTVHVCYGDITQMCADVIVSAANESLQQTTGVARAIAEAAGSKLKDECKEYIKKHGNLEVSQLIPTTGGNLNCDYVLHAVGPRWSKYADKEKCVKDLYATILACLNVANANKARSIAFPAISSGISAVPKVIVAKAIYDAVVQYDSTFEKDFYLRDITCLTIDRDVNQEIANVFRKHGKVDITKILRDFTSASTSDGKENGANSTKQSTQQEATHAKQGTKAMQTKDGGQPHQLKPSVKGCSICQGDIVDRKTLDKCKHAFCKKCIDASFKTIGPKCPQCGNAYGILWGNQPENATMDVVEVKDLHLSGFGSSSTYVITYMVPAGMQTTEHPHPGRNYREVMRTAYLPANTEGKKLIKFLKKAFDARLIFTIRSSSNKGTDDKVTWGGIPHKTSKDGGPAKFGYPDNNYLRQLRQALASKGIK